MIDNILEDVVIMVVVVDIEVDFEVFLVALVVPDNDGFVAVVVDNELFVIA